FHAETVSDAVWARGSGTGARHRKQADWFRLLYGAGSEGLEYAGDRRWHRVQRQTGFRQGLRLSRLREKAALHTDNAVPDRFELKTVHRRFLGHAGRRREADLGEAGARVRSDDSVLQRPAQ